MRTAGNVPQELRDYLVSKGYSVHLSTRLGELQAQWDGVPGLFEPYLTIRSTPAILRGEDKHACDNQNATRTMYLTLIAVGPREEDRDRAAELLEEVNKLIEGKWEATDSATLIPAAIYGDDDAYVNTRLPRVTHAQRYKVKKNIHKTL